MIPNTAGEIESARKECEAMLGKRALVSALAGLSPVIGPDLIADTALLLDLLPRINKRFGLTPEQIELLDDKMKVIVYDLIKAAGEALVGKCITKAAVASLMKKIGVRIGAKTITKYVPVVGSVASGVISYGGMRYMGRVHIRQCVEVCTQAMKITTTGPKEK